MTDKITFKTNEILAISTGEYSDYMVNGLFKVTADFDAKEKLKEWASETGRPLINSVVKADDNNQKIEFTGWLNKNNYIQDVEYRELHTDYYGDTVLTEYQTYNARTQLCESAAFLSIKLE
jgi:hypothetical protein